MTSNNEESDFEDDPEFVATQTERNIRDEINKKYGDLPKDTFKETVLNEVSITDLLEIRQSLYDLSVLTVPGTPRGTLSTRKDRIGGASAADKIAEDVFLLNHYLQGDTTINLTKCLSEKSKKQILQKRQLNATTTQDSTSARNTDATQATHDDISIRQFCVSVLSEMRKDRDILLTEVAALRGDSSLLKQIRGDVNDIRQELAQTRDRVSQLEVLIPLTEGTISRDPAGSNNRYSQLQKTVQKLQKRTAVVEQSLASISSIGKDVRNQVANNYGSLTNRINQLELGLRSPQPQLRQPVPSQHLTSFSISQSQEQQQVHRNTQQPGYTHISAQPRTHPTVHQASHPHVLVKQHGVTTTQATPVPHSVCVVPETNLQQSTSPSQTRVKTVVSKPEAQNSTGSDTTRRSNTGDTQSSTDDSYSRSVDFSNATNGSVVVTVGSQNTPSTSETTRQSSTRPNTHDKGGLQGYIPQARRPQYKVFFVSGISRNSGEDIEDSLRRVTEYMESNGGKVKSVRRVKINYRTLSVKVVVFEESAKLVASSIFWPVGIQSRPWED